MFGLDELLERAIAISAPMPAVPPTTTAFREDNFNAAFAERATVYQKGISDDRVSRQLGSVTSAGILSDQIATIEVAV